MIRKRFLSLAAFAAVSLTCLASVQGALLNAGAILTPPEPDPTGGLLVGSLVQPFVTPPGVGQFSGLLSTWVYYNDPSNPFAGIGDPNPLNHGLTFVYQLHNDAVSTTSIGRMTNIDFTPFQTDVSYQPAGGVLVPTSTDRNFASTVGWSFTGVPVGLGRLVPGLTTALLVIQTNAPGYVDVLANVIDGSVVQVPTFGPSPNPPQGGFPEPSSFVLLLIGACGLVRHRQNRSTR